ncbi:MAG: YraN family protein [Rhodospirillaceae bacterium]|jgi:putative endonuclease|nr:YraN family protein [Rhodospirillaceae bacterium]MBT3886436.1 YraN family protein [Rhodospirillaceae bacterium]MBT4118260.1 YraN family protein [Rhodospirillaceae bacterium]MBT4673103.1 YraN family protein [Rhodospirillaceae bacterium]MBT4721295.1 YraN family protein [Rhodospirillaceae bacterium]
MAEASRQRARLFGIRAERLARLYLRCKGYRILERGYRTPVGEIDIIARRGRALAFVEVKARRDFESAAYAIGQRQQERITRAAGAYIARHPGCAELNLRFDVILMAPGGWPKHIPGAWRPKE